MGKKWSESRPAEKMLSLYTLLLTSSQPVRLTELSRLLNCAKQSVTRLIDQLESSHFGRPIELHIVFARCQPAQLCVGRMVKFLIPLIGKRFDLLIL